MSASTDRASVPGPLPHVALILALTACADGPGPESGPDATTVRDSAGVRIVTSERPRWGEGAGWTVTPEPAVTIGVDDAMGGDETDVLFGSIRAMAVLPSGRLAVADEHSAVVSVFDPDGQLVHRFGGRGEGPGEVAGIWDLYGCADDTVIVRIRTQLSFFGGDGEFIRRVISTGAGTSWGVRAIAPDCAHFVVSRSADGPVPPAGQEWLSRRVLARTDDTFVVRDTIARMVTSEAFTRSLRGEEVSAFLPWTPVDFNVALRGDQLVAGFGKWAEFRVHSAGGRLDELIRWHAVADEVTAADRNRYNDKRNAFLDRYQGSPDALFSFPSLREFPRVPTHKPFFDGFLLDDQGNIWARHFPPNGLGIQDLRPPHDPPAPETWTVLNSAGVWLGPVHLPGGFAAHDVANDRVYGVYTAPHGAQTVRVYRLVRDD